MRGFIYASVVFVSGSYHLCKGPGICLLPYPVHFFLDFLFSITALMANLLFLAPFGQSHGPTKKPSYVPVYGQYYTPIHDPRWDYTQQLDAWLIGANMLVIGLSLAIQPPLHDPPIWFIGILAGFNVAVVFFVWIYLWMRYHIPPSFDWRDFFIAFVFALSGIGLFVLQDKTPSYAVIHSIWHVLAALGSFYLLETRCNRHSGWKQWGLGKPHEDLKHPYQRNHLV
jgi:hypothetical protein